jgi:hypothetical protein
MNIYITFEDSEEEKVYPFDSMTDASIFMGLLQIGIKLNDEMYVMDEHYYDVESDSVKATCIKQTTMEKRLEEEKRKMMKEIGISPGFASRLIPPFKMDGGDGGGFLN